MKRGLIALLVLVLLAGAGGGALYYARNAAPPLPWVSVQEASGGTYELALKKGSTLPIRLGLGCSLSLRSFKLGLWSNLCCGLCLWRRCGLGGLNLRFCLRSLKLGFWLGFWSSLCCSKHLAGFSNNFINATFFNKLSCRSLFGGATRFLIEHNIN